MSARRGIRRKFSLLVDGHHKTLWKTNVVLNDVSHSFLKGTRITKEALSIIGDVRRGDKDRDFGIVFDMSYPRD